MEDLTAALSQEMGLKREYVQNVVRLIDEGNTIPFIARYRKELHGAMDDQLLRKLSQRLTELKNLKVRGDQIRAAAERQGKLTGKLDTAIAAAGSMAELEDLYRPLKQKRCTRAMAAKKRGLEPLAQLLFGQTVKTGALSALALPFLSPEQDVPNWETAVAGASDIIAEQISDDAGLRSRLRSLMWRAGILVSESGKEEDSVYRRYDAFSCPVHKLQGHQILAINRGEREGFLKVTVSVPEESALQILFRAVLSPGSITTGTVRAAAMDAYRRLIFPSLERESRGTLTKSAAEGAIRIFSLNVTNLLMQPPIAGKTVLGLDPAYRTGCKLAVVDPTGKVLETAVIYPTPPHQKTEEAKKILKRLIAAHHVDMISIGNGTASRESERFISDFIEETGVGLTYMVVSEAGASVYSASELAAKEFPEYDVSLRSAVSIARRLQDPLAELVKIDPKALGVGQYQHDMPQNRLDEALSGVVEDCVNRVGVNLNTASVPLLTRVSGLNAGIARTIVSYREEHGPFSSRLKLLKVPRLGPKTFEQCAGFLRLPECETVLDNTAVHPESYAVAEKLISLCGYRMEDVKAGNCSDLSARLSQMGEEAAATACGVGVPTLLDIAAELIKPGRDPRDSLPPPLPRTHGMELSDLSPGMVLTGTVRNVMDFGIFVDVGVHQDGLVHISELADRYIKHPSEVAAVGDVVTVQVIGVDVPKKRLSLSMKQAKHMKKEGTEYGIF